MREVNITWFRGAIVAVCVLAALLAGCSKDPNVRKQKYLESGQRYYDKGQYHEAAIQFQNAIQVDSRFAEAHFKLGQTATKLNQWTAASQEFARTIQLNPDHYGARLELAKLLIFSRQFPPAKEHLDLLVQKDPGNPEVYLALATYYDTDTKDEAAAFAAVHKALQLDPNRSESYLSLGILDVQNQQWLEAETNLKKAVELDPKSVDALIALGNFYQARGRYPESEQVYRRAIQTLPTDADPRLALAGLFLAQNKLGMAEDFLRQSKTDFPENSKGYCMLGNFYIQTNQMDKALAEYAGLYQAHPKDPDVRKNYIKLLIMKGSVEDARKINDPILKSQPSDIDAQIFKAEIEIRGGKANDAADTLQGVLKIDPDSAEAHYQLGLAFDQMGSTNRSGSEWREAVRLAPDFLDAHVALAGTAIRQGDWSFLAQEAEQIRTSAPANPQGYWLHAMADINRKQYASADGYIKQALDRDPNNAPAYLQLGDLRLAQNQFAEAEKAYQHALDLDPSSLDALTGLVNVAKGEKQPERAIAAIKTQLAKNPDNSGFHGILGDLLKERKDFPGAEAEYKRAAELNKNNIAAVVNVGMLQIQRGAQDTALQTYMDAVQNNPREGALFLLAGNVYENKQDWVRARQMYEKALTVQPDNPVASNDLAYVMLQQGGNVDVAFAMAQTARRQLPDNAASADTLGWAFYQKHVYTSAIGLFQEAIHKEPENATFNYHLGMAYAKNGQAALAKQQLDRVVKIKPNSSEAEDLRRALAEMKS